MSITLSSAPGSPNQSHAATASRPFYWSVKRELWENRSIYFAPLIVSGVILFGLLIGSYRLPNLRRNAMALGEAGQRAAIQAPYNIVAIMLIFTAFIVGVFYCLDALHGERRDRSILFWKSLPISDLTTVLSKATVPLLVIPVVTFVIVIFTHFTMLLLSTAALFSSGMAGSTWANFNLFRESFVLLYGLIAIALWHAPIYGWLLLVSGWARRATFLWAVLPPIAVIFFEKITFDTWHFASMLGKRIGGFAPNAFTFHRHQIESVVPTPAIYFSRPDLWLGLAFAAAFIAAAIRMRRYRGPL